MTLAEYFQFVSIFMLEYLGFWGAFVLWDSFKHRTKKETP